MENPQKTKLFLDIILEALENQVATLKTKQANDPDSKFEIKTSHSLIEVQYVLSLVNLLVKVGPDIKSLMSTLSSKTPNQS